MLRREERWLALIASIVFALLNALTVTKYYGAFSQLTDHYHRLFVKTFHISGFDPLTYVVLSNWDTSYNVYRHPLLAFFMFPLNQINQGLMMLTGMNWATILTAILLTACSTASCLLLFRIAHQMIGLSIRQSYMMCAFYFSFAFVMLSTMVPDHFVLSMTMLLLTIYCSRKPMNKMRTAILFFFTAGISLNNGLKVFIAALLNRGKRFFKPSYLMLAVIIPAAMMWCFARWEYKNYVWPKEMVRYEKKKQADRRDTERLRAHIADSLMTTGMQITTHDDSLKLNAIVKKEKQKRAVAKYRADHKKIWNKNTGKPIGKGEFARWTDISTPRWDSIVENLFGEGIILHSDYVLGDVLRDRPVIVRYKYVVNYVIEAIIILLFIAGIWYGRKSRLLWTAMTFFMMDMLLHIVLGFGINEVYIMSPHYLFVIPIAVAFALRNADRRLCKAMTASIILITAYCWVWNVHLIINHLIG